MKVLHIIPDSVYDPKQFFLGSTKDIRGRTEYFKERGIAYSEFIVEKRKDGILLQKLKAMDLEQFKIVICEFLYYPRSVKFIKENYPHIKIIMRSHNAELLHRLHYIKSSFVHGQWKSLLINARALIKLSFLELICVKWADSVMSISAWEKLHYLPYVTGRANAEYLPYFIPASYKESCDGLVKKTKHCVCMTSTGMNSFVLDATKNFIKIINKLNNECRDWNFSITGNIEDCRIKIPSRIKQIGFLDNPHVILAESRALALISDYGYGFKTKLLDAIYHKCYLLVTTPLYQRLPVEIHKYCVIVDINSKTSFQTALEKCLEPYPEGSPNEMFREQAFAVLDKVVYG